MDLSHLHRHGDCEWHIPREGGMNVPGVLYADEALVRDMDPKVREQMVNVARLPGIVGASYAMPDAHWGYGFPIGGVAAFDPDQGGVVSAGGVGFDISCGVRTLTTDLRRPDIEARKRELASALFDHIPAGLGSRGSIHLTDAEIERMLSGGAEWAVAAGWGEPADLALIEERGRMRGAEPACVSTQARTRQRDELGTLGSGNHYLEVQEVTAVAHEGAAQAFGIRPGDIVLSIHCGSRGLGHQIGSEFLKRMAHEAPNHGIVLPDRELACAPLDSALGREYLGAMRAGINCALANREVITHLTREVFRDLFPAARLGLIYDVSHNTCKEEWHQVAGRRQRLFVHRKGATRAFGPGHPELPARYRDVGQPVFVGGSMGTASYILVGGGEGSPVAFGSACHGAGRAMSRREALRRWRGRAVVDSLAERGIVIRSPSYRGVAEEAPNAYKDIGAVVTAAERAGLARIAARLEPLVCIKG